MDIYLVTRRFHRDRTELHTHTHTYIPLEAVIRRMTSVLFETIDNKLVYRQTIGVTIARRLPLNHACHKSMKPHLPPLAPIHFTT